MITVYSASAGSGKTYTLTREFLTLALGENATHAYRHILAVTFTNKATGEMKHRIVKELRTMRMGVASPMANEIAGRLNVPFSTLQARADQALTSILHNYSAFAVSTIDSFFQKLIRNFTREAGLQGGFKLELDTQYVLDAVTRQVFARIGQPGYEQLEEWIIAMAREKVVEGDKWDFRAEMMALGKELFREKLMRKESELEELHVNSPEFPENKKKLLETIAQQENKIKSAAADILKKMNAAGITPEDFAYAGKGTIVNYLEKVESGEWELPKSRALEMLENSESCFTKSNKKRNQLIDAYERKIQGPAQTLVAQLEKSLPFLLTAIEIRKNLNILGLVGSIREELKIFRENENLLLLPDTTLLLFKIMQENDASFVYEKAGNYYNHFLIDEFQDTSRTQWENFKPLLVNSIANGNENLIVGDIKQSIYRWRDGDWRLLYGAFSEGIHPELIQQKNLQYNYRSHPEIIRFNNSLFAKLTEIAAVELAAKIPDTQPEKPLWMEQIRGLFQHATQRIPDEEKKASTGYVRMEIIETKEIKEYNKSLEDPEEKTTWKKEAMQKLHRQILELQDHGYFLDQMAILVRSKSQGSEIMQFLTGGGVDQIPIACTSSEALPLSQAVSVQLIILSLKLLLDENNDPAWAALTKHHHFHENETEWINRWMHNKQELYPQWLSDETERARLRRLPLFELFNEIIRLLNLTENKWKKETGYLTGFLDAVLEFLKEENPDPEQFLQWWENTGKNRPVQMTDRTDSIKILTIHKSKGLEFPVVLIPFLDWEVLPRATLSPWLWCNPAKQNITALKLAPVKYGSRLENTLFSTEYFEEMQLNYADNLNLIYVALTRAADVLWGCIPVSKNDKGEITKGRISSHLYQSLDRLSTGEAKLHADEYGFYSGSLESLHPPTREITNGVPEIDLVTHPWLTRLRVKKISRKLPAGKKEKEKIQYGIMLHTVMEKIQHREDVARAIQEWTFSGYLSALDREEMMQKIQSVLQHPDLQEWFTGKYTIRNEVSLLENSGAISRPDRVMMNAEKIIIADFKTGKARPEHKNQILRYAEIIGQIESRPVEGWLVYFESDEIRTQQVL